MLALEPNHDRVRGNFLANVLRRSLPASAGIIVALVAVQIGERVFGFSYAEASTLSMFLSGLVGIALIVRISQPLNPLRWALLASVVVMLLGGSILFKSFFKLAPMNPTMYVFLGVIGVLSLLVFMFLYNRLDDKSRDTDPVAGLVESLMGGAK